MLRPKEIHFRKTNNDRTESNINKKYIKNPSYVLFILFNVKDDLVLQLIFVLIV